MTDLRFPVEAGHIMMFARAIGDDNPAYGGDAPLAPPTFTMSSAHYDPEYHLRPKPGEEWWGSGGGPGVMPEGGGGLHAEQHFEYHQPMRPGMQLTATQKQGNTWEKESKRGGKLKFSETVTEFRDAATGELVVTARMVGVRTERPVDKEA